GLTFDARRTPLSRSNVTRWLDHLGFAQFRDLARREAEFGQQFLGLFAELRRRCRHPARRARQLEGLADQPDMAVLGVGNVLRDAEVFYLRILKGLVDGVDRTAGHAGLVQFLDPGVGRFLLGELVDLGIQRLAVLRAVRRGDIFRSLDEFGRAERLGAAL